MLINNIYTFKKNSVYSLVHNVGDGLSKFFIARQKLDDNLDNYYELFTIGLEPSYFKSIDEHSEIIEKPLKGKKPFITSQTYNALIDEIETFMDRERSLSLEFKESNAFSIEEIKQGGLTPKSQGEETMNTIEMKQFLKEMQEANMEFMKDVKLNNPYEEAIVEGIIEKGKAVSADSILEHAKEEMDRFITDNYGSLPKKIKVELPDVNTKELEGLFHEKFEHILKLVTANIPTALIGPAGSGKNHTLEQIAEAIGLDFYFSNAITQEFKLTGFIDANGRYHETQFFKAFKEGGLFFLDEMDASIPEVLLILNSAIANKYFDFPTGRVQAHPDFRVVAAANTMGTGADSMYTGRQQLDAATLDRFAQVPFDYDSEVEKQLSSNSELYDFVTSARQAIKEKGLRYTVSMRAIINASKIDGLLEDTFAISGIILKTIPEDELEMIADDLPRSNRYTRALRSIIWKNEGEIYTQEQLTQLALAA